MNRPENFTQLAMPTPLRESEDIAKLKKTLLKDIQRSAYVYRVDCGGCNGCEIEIFASITPLFDTERFGIKVVASPRHADILLFTGAVTRSMRMPALRAYHAAPDPKICVSYGACGCGGGIFHDLYCVWGGHRPNPACRCLHPRLSPDSGRHDLWLRACAWPARPETQGQGTHRRGGRAAPSSAILLVPLDLTVLVEREARRMAGYRHGGQIADKYLKLLATPSVQTMDSRIKEFLQQEDDPRVAEIVGNLRQITGS